MTENTWPAWVCPVHRKTLMNRNGDFACPDGCSYASSKGIPRFVPNSSYTAAFGLQWNRYRLTQLDSHSGVPISRDRLARCFGHELWNQLQGKYVLEAGCGAGRFTEVLLERGALVTSVDLSEAVEANQDNFPQNAAHRIAQADILKLPFAPRQFDVVLCLGVVQHTPDPEQTIAALYNQVKPSGWLIFDHYTHSLSYYTKSARLFRIALRRMPPDKGLKWTERLVDVFLPLHKAARSFRPAQMVLSRVSPVLCYYQTFPGLTDEQHREWALLDTHDSLTDWFKHFRTREQIRATLERLDAKGIRAEYGGNGVEARCQRPTT